MEKETPYITVALADDHVLLRSALASLIDSFGDCRVIHQANNGGELINFLKEGLIPDVVVLDLNMPQVDGFEAARYIQKNYPGVNVLMLTMYDTDLTLIRLLQAGVKGFLKKDIHPDAVRKITRVRKLSDVAAARISGPARPGKEMSSTAMSGDKARMACMHFVPSLQLATTLKPFCAWRRVVRPHRTTGWRSAMTTLTQRNAHLCNAHAESY